MSSIFFNLASGMLMLFLRRWCKQKTKKLFSNFSNQLNFTKFFVPNASPFELLHDSHLKYFQPPNFWQLDLTL